MEHLKVDNLIIEPDDLILITGATGFIGSKVVESLLDRGFRQLLCFVRPTSDVSKLNAIASRCDKGVRVGIIEGNLLSPEDCVTATKDATVIFHLAAGGSDKSFPDAFMNSAVTTRNLLEASLRRKTLRRFVNISSLAVYSNIEKRRGRLLDESCPVEERPELRGDAYCFAKIKQDEIVTEYGNKCGISYVIIRPGYVYGPGKKAVSSRVGIDSFGIFLHLGGSNPIPFTYVDNCAEAIVLAGLKKGVEGNVFNIMDDDLPSSRQFLRQYKRNVRRFKSIYVPHIISHALCCMWEQYSKWSAGQLPPVFNSRRWHAYWKKTYYSNEKLKKRVGWTPRVPMAEGLRVYFESCRDGKRHA
jgi:nucleoside-diphosphate-sugar epimerase